MCSTLPICIVTRKCNALQPQKTYYKIWGLYPAQTGWDYADKQRTLKIICIVCHAKNSISLHTRLSQNSRAFLCSRPTSCRNKTGFAIDKLPIFSPQSNFVFEISVQKVRWNQLHFLWKCNAEIRSDLCVRGDLLRNHLLEIHYGKTQPIEPSSGTSTHPHASSHCYWPVRNVNFHRKY